MEKLQRSLCISTFVLLAVVFAVQPVFCLSSPPLKKGSRSILSKQGNIGTTELSPTQYLANNKEMMLHYDEPSFFAKLSRRISVFWLAGQIFASYKIVQRKEKKLRRRLGIVKDSNKSDDYGDDHPEILALWDLAHEQNALRILRAIETLQGFWIKIGQYLSSRADVMPPQYLQTLSSLQDGVPAKPFADIEATLKEQFSPKEMKQIVDIDPQPLSTASLAQVHRARLAKNGREVVLKVQHRGVASLMLQDMDNFRTVLRLLAIFEPDMDYNPVVDEYTLEVRKELDFRTECRNMQEIKQMLEERKIRAIVPEAIPELVTEKILVMEYCQGFPIRDLVKLDAHGVDRRVLLERVVTSWAAQMHILATFNADPHAGNILVSTSQEDGDTSVPVLLDFGLTKRLNPHMKVAFSRLVHSSYETDVDGLLQSFDEMGLKLNRYDPFQDMQNMQSALSDPAPQSQAAHAKKQKMKKWKEQKESMRKEQGLTKGQKLRNPVDAWPSELIFFTRVSAMLRGLCSRLEVQYPYLACMAVSASETLRNAVPQNEHADATVYDTSDVTIDSKLQQRLRGLAKELIDEDHAIGFQVYAIHQGEIVANIAAGGLGTVNPRPVRPESLFNVFSVSKAALTAGALKLLQERNISVDDPIAKYWPAFGASHAEKRLVTIRHVLTHQAGLANAFPSNATIEILTDWDYMKKFIGSAEAIPSHRPGKETNYHYLTFAWLVGGFIEEVTGEPYAMYLNKHLIDPLDLQDELHMGGLPDGVAREALAVLTARTLSEGVNRGLAKKAEETQARSSKAVDSSSEAATPETKSRLAKFRGQQQMMNPSVFNMRRIRSAKIPSANGHASARALAILMNAITASERILSPETMKLAGTPQECSGGRSDEGASAMLDNAQASFGLGFQIHNIVRKADGAVLRSVGHAGFGGSIVISIPEIALTVAFTTNQLKLKSVARDRVLRAVLGEIGLDAPPSLVENQ